MVLKTIINLYLHKKNDNHCVAMQSSVMPDLSIELEETHNRRLFNRFVAWLCHDTLFWEQKSLANFEFFVPLPHFNGFNGLDYGVSSFWLVLWNIWLHIFIQGPNHEFSSDETKSNRRLFEGKGFASLAYKPRSYIWLHLWIHSHCNFL